MTSYPIQRYVTMPCYTPSHRSPRFDHAHPIPQRTIPTLPPKVTTPTLLPTTSYPPTHLQNGKSSIYQNEFTNWHPNSQKLFTIAMKCIELNLCITIRCTKCVLYMISLGSILTKIFDKNLHDRAKEPVFRTFGIPILENYSR